MAPSSPAPLPVAGSASEAEVLRLLDNGLQLQRVSERTGLTRAEIRGVGQRNGRIYDVHERRMRRPGAPLPPRLARLQGKRLERLGIPAPAAEGPLPPRALRHQFPARAAGQRFPCAANPDLFFTEARAAVDYARNICHTCCTARAPCLEGALQRGEREGVWGGELFQMGQIVVLPEKASRPQCSPQAARLAAERRRKNIAAINRQSAKAAALRMCERLRQALAVLSPDDMSSLQAEAAKLRLEHPEASVSDLADLASPPVSRHAIASRLRTLLKTADRVLRAEGEVA